MSVFELPFNDPYHSIIYTQSSSPSPSQPSSEPTQPQAQPPFSSATMSSSLISSTPTPITRFLILSQPYARYARTGVEVLLWRGGKERGKGWSWAVVCAWWAVCLGGWEVVRFLLPPLLLFLYFLPSLPLPRIFHSSSSSSSTSPSSLPPISPPRPKKKEAPTAQTLLTTVSDFSSIHSLLCQAWPEWLETPDRTLEAFGWKRVGRGLVGVWIVWVLGGWVLGLSVMLGLIGTVLLLLPSPYFRPLLNATQSSYLLRRITTFISLVVLGPSPSSSSSSFSPRDASTNLFTWAWKQAKSDEEDASKKVNASTSTSNTRGRSSSIKEVLWAGLTAAVPKKLAATKEEREEEEREEREQEWQEEPVQFRFEVMENQRWWLALDWTTTLAPSDRPVWCDTHLNPTPPPSQFTLPPASTILLPDPSSSTHQIQRTAIWHWLDPDWSIGLHLPNSPGATSFVPSSSPRSPTSSTNNPLPPHKDHHHHNNGNHHGHHTSISSQPLSPSSSSTATVKAMSLGEQALSKGLERLKAVSLQASSSSSLASLTGVGSSSNVNSNSNANANGAGGGLTSPSRSSSVDAGLSAGKTLFAMSQPEGGASGPGSGVAGETMMMEVDDLDAGTDESGWSYGGNKWEGMGAKGGLGKFTRRRRWTRLALLTEHVQLVPLPPPAPSSPASINSTTSNPTPIGLPPRRSSSLSRSPTREKNAPLPALPSQVHATTAGAGETAGGDGGVGGALRMRLKKAVEGHGEHS